MHYVSVRDLLLRDNLFEIITSSRTFYIQVDTIDFYLQQVSHACPQVTSCGCP